ncbi:MAG: hypothetical protein II089_12655, partial [Selenomonas sp.]|nr:hypothetical protein [Selenomonas sp.]
GLEDEMRLMEQYSKPLGRSFWQRDIQGWDRNSYKVRVGTGKVPCQFSCILFVVYGRMVIM